MLLVWIGIGVAALLVELMTPTALVSIWFAGGAAIAAILTAVRCSLEIQIVSFFGVSIIMMLIVRPIATRYLRGNIVPTNADRLIGETGTVTKSILEDRWGEVYVRSTYWSAVSMNQTDIIKGKKVRILAIEGVKLIVKEI